MGRRLFFLLSLAVLSFAGCEGKGWLLRRLPSPVLLSGNDSTAYRDPAVLYHEHTFHLFFTVTKVAADSIVSYVAESESRDLRHWTPPEAITPVAQQLGYSSPGNVIRRDGEWILCFQSYPRPDYKPSQGVRYGNEDARLFIMRSQDLKHWSAPELLRVKGDVPVQDMGRMIDPYLIEDKDEAGKWWCFYKQDGASMSYSYDLVHWTYSGRVDAGENVSVLVDRDEYVMFHSPSNGIAVKRSGNLRDWREEGPLITLGQQDWPWAGGRITAGAVIDMRDVKKCGCYLMFFHGSGPRTEAEGDFNRNASIGLAWSDDLKDWRYPCVRQ